jgi:hypothetical protein
MSKYFYNIISLKTLNTLAKSIAITGGMSIIILINSVPYLHRLNITKSNHYKQAMELLHNHPEAIKALGEPIQECKIQTTNRKNYGTDGKKSWINVPVKGPNDKGYLFYEFPVVEDGKPIELTKVELSVNKMKDYKLLIKREV